MSNVRQWPASRVFNFGTLSAGETDTAQVTSPKARRFTATRVYVEAREDSSLNTQVETPYVDVTFSDKSGSFLNDTPVCAIAGTKQFPCPLPRPIVIEGQATLDCSAVNLSATDNYVLRLVLVGFEEGDA